MEAIEKRSAEKTDAMDVEFIPYVLMHKIHRNLKSSQVEIVPLPHYFRDETPEPEPELETEMEPEVQPPTVVFAPPLPALKEKKNWWDFIHPVYGFNNPRIRSRLEKLMSSQIVHVTDRKYMTKLQEKIKEDHLENLRKRIQEREVDEIEREKILLLEGKIPFEEAPKELKNHPVCKINQLSKKIMEDKRAKTKFHDKTHAYRTPMKRIRVAEKTKKDTVFVKDHEDEDMALSSAAICIVDAEVSEDISKGLMFSKEDYNNLKYEDPQIKYLRQIDVVHEMYEIADKIVGSTKPAKMMGPKRAPKLQSRWQPLPEGASIMQVIGVPEIDEHTFHPDEMTKEELVNCAKYIEQSNNTLEVENMIIEKYLRRMDPTSLEKMNQILEAAALAIQKAERTAHLGGGGGGGSTFSISKDGMGSRITDDSASSSSKEGTSKSTPTRTKLGFFGLSDKGPRVQASQKIEIVNREIDEMKTVLESFRKKARNFNYTLRCRCEEMTERLQEITEAQMNFEQKLMIDGLDPITGKLPGEKFIRYQEVRLKTAEIEIDRIRIKTGSLKSQLKKVKQQLAQKEELGEVLHAVDFEQLQIENMECQERLEEKVGHLIDVKTINGKYGTLLNANKRKLQDQVNRLAELQENAVVKEQMIEGLQADEERVNKEVTAAENSVTKIIDLMKAYTVPDVMEYINKKAQVNTLKKEIKVLTRQVELKDLELAGQLHKIRNLGEIGKSDNQLRSVSSIKSYMNF